MQRTGLTQLSPERLELIARMIQEKKGRAAAAAPLERQPRRAGEASVFPLSFAQERLWFLDALEPGLVAYNEPSLTRIRGELRLAALRSAFETVLARQEGLSTTFRLEGDAPVQVVAPWPEPVVLPLVDLSRVPAEKREQEARRSATAVARRPFDLARGPLWRAVLYRTGEREHLLLMVFHHIVADGWSYLVLIAELAAAYAALAQGRQPALPDLPVQYADFACWQRRQLEGEAIERPLAYWRQQLAGAPAVLDLPTDRPRPLAPSWAGGQVPFAFPAELYAALRARAAEGGVTLVVVLLAAFQVLLSRYSGAEDLAVGMPVAGRNRSEVEGLAGFFVNTLVLRGRGLRGGLPLIGLLAELEQSLLDGLAHQDLPFDRLVQALGVERNPAVNPLFQAALAFQNALPGGVAVPGLELAREGLDIGTAKFDLMANLFELDGRLAGWLEYDRELFDRSTAERLARHFHALLASVAAAGPERAIGSLPMLTAALRQQLLAEWEDTAADLGGERLLHQLFEQQAAATPDALALSFESAGLSYRELDRRADQMGRWLQERGVGPEVLVGVLLERSLEMVVALLGILKAGGAYVPLDPTYPKERLSFFLADAAPPVVLTASAFADLVPSGLPAVFLDTGWEAIAAADGPLAPGAGPGSLAYTIYTSGSTGRPKGAMNSHRGIVNRLLWARRQFALGAGDRLLQKTPFSFDVSVWELFWPLAVGAHLVMARPEGHRDPGYLAAVIAERRITHLHFVPSMLRAFVDAGVLEQCSGVERVLTSGEELGSELAARFAERLPGSELHNLYGPTEAAVEVTAWQYRGDEGRAGVPIGRPIANLRVPILDRRGGPVPLGVAGELLIGGVGVGRGYLRRPALTAEKFVPDPMSREPGGRLYRTGDLARHRTDGAVDFLGRIDHQVKIRGFRIELGEIEHAIKALPGVSAVVVTARGQDSGRRLVAYVVTENGHANLAAWRQSLGERLPEHMLPSAWVTLAALPLLSNGKVDRKALPEPAEARRQAERVPPRTYLEERVAAIWGEVLGTDRPGGAPVGNELGVTDNLFELGAHSLLTTQVKSRLDRELAIDLPLRRFFELPTVAQQAAAIEELRRSAAALPAPPILPAPRGGVLPLSFSQQRIWFFDRWEPGSAVFNLPTAVALDGLLSVPALAAALNDILRRHEVLRSRFLDLGGEPGLAIAPFARTTFPVVDLSALPAPAAEAERELLERREAVRPLDLATGPMLRGLLLRLAPRRHHALLTLHHIAADGWSMRVLTEELSAAYQAFASGIGEPPPELPIQYADYALWQRQWLQGEVLAAELEFWKRQLAGAPESLDLPFDRPRLPVQRYRGDRSRLGVTPEVTAALRGLAREARGTLFMVLVTAWKALLLRYSNQDDIAIGTLLANRHRREVEGLIGFFVNTMVLRTRMPAELTFRQAIDRVRETTLEVYAHQDLPFEKLVGELNPDRHLALTPLFQTLFVLQNAPAATLELPGLTLSTREIERGAVNYDLVFFVEERGAGIHGDLDFDTDLFDATTIRRLLAHYELMLAALAENPDRRWREVPLLTAVERQQLLAEWNDTAQGDSPATTFHELFAAQVRRRPTALAAVCGEERLTYAELGLRVERGALSLAGHGFAQGRTAAVLADRGLGFLATTLALLRMGGAYLPLDPAHPERRIGQILAGADLPLVLVASAYRARIDGALAEALPALRPRVVEIESLFHAPPEGFQAPPEGEAVPDRALPAVCALPEDLAYVLFTSGSTGVPKGVMIDQRGMVNHLRANIEVLDLAAGDVVAQNASQCFDISVWQLFAALAVGGVVRIARNEIAHDPVALLREVEAGGVTILELVPSLLAAMLEEIEGLGGGRPALATLRWIMPTGEALPPALCERWLAQYPGIPMLNAYGPAECADDVSFEAIRRPGEAGERTVSIGRPVRNLGLYVLDRERRPVPIGVVGEIHVGGVGVGRGYLGDRRRTAQSFLPNGCGPNVPAAGGSRLYASGDLARLLPDGRLEFLGRVDHQVKVRGFRIETGEIEAVLGRHPGVEQAVVVARPVGAARPEGDGGSGDGSGTNQLVAYLVSSSAEAVSSSAEPGDERERIVALRDYLGERLPDYMVPSLFVFLAALPLTPNGKVDHRALPAPLEALREAAGEGGRTTPPRTRSERAVAAIWSEVLGIERIGVEDSFFALGGHSLLATQVLSRLRASMGVDLPLRELFEAQNLGALAARVEAAAGITDELAVIPILPAPEEDLGLLSFAQERLWFLDQFDPGSPAYNLPNAIRMEGAVDPRALGRALREVARRHSGLRMVFHTAQGRARQTIRLEVDLAMPVVDLGGLAPGDRDGETRRLAGLDARRPFDLERGPLLRAALVRHEAMEGVLLLTMHHIVSDGWSLGVFLAEVAEIYPAFATGRPSPLPELALQYPDYSSWQRKLLAGEILERQLTYWKEQLANAPAALDLAGRGTRPAADGPARGSCRWFTLSGPLAAGLKALSRRQGTTLFMTLLSGFAAVLNRSSGATDLMIGVPVAGRGRPELEALIGFFVNTIVVRVGMEGAPSAEELLARVRQVALDAFSHQDAPFEKLVAELNPDRDLVRSPLFQVMFALQNAPAPTIELPGLTLSRLEIDPGTIRFELYLELTETEHGLDGMVQFSRDLFDPSFIARFVRHFETLLEGMVSRPADDLAALPLLAPAERAQLLVEWNDSARQVASETPFERLFAATAARFPDRVAVSCEGESLTYAALDARAAGLAARLQEIGAGTEAIVAILAPRGLDFLGAVLGAFKAGAAYLPLDPHHPAPRIRQILEQGRASVVLAAEALAPLADEALAGFAGAPPPVLALEAPAAVSALEAGRRSGVVDAGRLAYVIFTSGSTGVPKGAMLSHRGLVNHLAAMQLELGLTADDAVAQTASQCFDISVWQFLNPLLGGGRVEIYPDAVAHDPALLLDRVERDGVTVLETVPSLMRLMLEEIGRRDGSQPGSPLRLARLRWLIPTGEAVPADLCRAWYEAFPSVPLLNGYGPAECSDDVSTHRISAAELEQSWSVSIGRPVVNTELYVLDRGLRPVPVRVAGELSVGGVGVGRGYLFDAAKTAAVFVPDPFSGRPGARLYRTGDLARAREDGGLEFLGRFDHQVKIRGFRLELGEIEALLGLHPALAAVVVMAQPEAWGTQRLVAYCVPRPPASPTPQELREHLGSRLPEYAIPTAWVMLESLPLSPNGKVDRRALPAPDDGVGGQERLFVEPRNEVEEAVAEVFAAVIGRERVGALDNFFDLGGHSLLATQATWRLRELFGVELALRTLFEAPTVAELAGVIEVRIIEQIESLSEDEVDSMLGEEAEAVALVDEEVPAS